MRKLTRLIRLPFSDSKRITKFVNYKAGGPENMFLDERELQVKDGEKLLKIKAVGINRAECLHRAGKYKITRPIEGFLGLEAAGEVYDPITNQKVHDGIALLTGGSYSQWASVPTQHILPLPRALSYVQGAAIPQAWSTAFKLLRLAQVKVGDDVVVYAGASGVGTAAIQLCKLLGAQAWAVVSTAQKGKICQQLGARVVYYKDNQNWHKELIEKKGGKGNFNAVLDCVGPANVDATLELLGLDGKWISYGLLSGAKANLNMVALLVKRISLITTTLKTRSDAYKASLLSDFQKTALSAFESGQLKPIIYKTYKCNWQSVDPFIQAHKLMQSNSNTGKIMIEFE